MTDLKIVIDVMLPSDSELDMPSSSVINFDLYLKKFRLEELPIRFLLMLQNVCQKKFSEEFHQLDPIKKIQAIQACRLADIQLFTSMVGHLLKAYYSAPEVLLKIGAGSAPPFPKGNLLDEDDWSILEPVYERGQIYR